jgi:hypothetical protein
MSKGRILTDYYKGERKSETKDRYDITFKTGSYPPFEEIMLNRTKFNVGGLSFYYTDSYGKEDIERKPQKCIKKSTHISGVFIPDLHMNKIGFGDTKNTEDALIFIFNEDYTTIEIFVARGKKNDSQCLYLEVKDGELNSEIEYLRNIATEVFKEPEN